MKSFFRLASALLLIVCVVQTAGAAIIDYDLSNITGDRWRYDYTIFNDTQHDISSIFIAFDYGQYDNLELMSWPAEWPSNWEELGNVGVYDPDRLLGEGALYAYMPDLDLFLPGYSLSFSVEFDWVAAGTPMGEQFFAMFADGGWTPVDSGYTPGGEPETVPEPQTFMLLGTGLLGLAAYYNRNRKR